jgi:hypothetical protein
MLAEVSANASHFFRIGWDQATILDRQGIELAHIDEAVKEAEWRGRDIAALDIRKGAAPSGGVIIIDDDLGMVGELSFKQISNTL